MITPSFGLTATERVLPKLALDFTTASLDSRVTFTRTTGASNPATYVNSSGIVTAATNNQPRFDYDPVALTCKGLLIEELRTNYIIYSDQFNNGNWVKEQTSISADAVVSPDGTQNADKLIEDNSTNIHDVYQGVAGLTDNTVYTVTVYAKAGERTEIYLELMSKTPTQYGARFNLSNGTVTTGGFNPPSSYSITPAGNGWYRCSVSNSVGTGAFNPRLTVGLYNGGTSYAGNGTSGAYFWGAQLELGAFPTSYIPTTSAALTRNADVATMTGTNFSSWYNASEGSFVTQYAAQANGTVLSTYLNPNGSIRLDNNAGYSRLIVENPIGSYPVVLSASSVTAGTFIKAAYCYKTNDFALCQNAGTVLTDTSGAVPTGFSTLFIGSVESNVGRLSGYIKNIYYYPQRLTNAQLQAFSK